MEKKKIKDIRLDRVYSIEEAAEILGVSTRSIFRRLKAGTLEGFQLRDIAGKGKNRTKKGIAKKWFLPGGSLLKYNKPFKVNLSFVVRKDEAEEINRIIREVAEKHNIKVVKTT